MLRKFIDSRKSLFRINYKPIKLTTFKHLDGSITLAISRWRLKSGDGGNRD